MEAKVVHQQVMEVKGRIVKEAVVVGQGKCGRIVVCVVVHGSRSVACTGKTSCKTVGCWPGMTCNSCGGTYMSIGDWIETCSTCGVTMTSKYGTACKCGVNPGAKHDTFVHGRMTVSCSTGSYVTRQRVYSPFCFR